MSRDLGPSHAERFAAPAAGREQQLDQARLDRRRGRKKADQAAQLGIGQQALAAGLVEARQLERADRRLGVAPAVAVGPVLGPAQQRRQDRQAAVARRLAGSLGDLAQRRLRPCRGSGRRA